MTMPIRMNRAACAAIALSLGLAVSGCNTPGTMNRSLNSVKQPVIEQSTFALDLSTTSDGLPVPEQHRLSDWFQAMNVNYGDRIAVDDASANPEAREDVARVAGAPWPAAKRRSAGHQRCSRAGHGARGHYPHACLRAQLPGLVDPCRRLRHQHDFERLRLRGQRQSCRDGRQSRGPDPRRERQRRHGHHDIDEGDRHLSRSRSRPEPPGCRPYPAKSGK